MTDRTEEIRSRINAANKPIILGTPTTLDEQAAAAKSSYQIVAQDSSYLLAEVERLRAALAEVLPYAREAFEGGVNMKYNHAIAFEQRLRGYEALCEGGDA